MNLQDFQGFFHHRKPIPFLSRKRTIPTWVAFFIGWLFGMALVLVGNDAHAAPVDIIIPVPTVDDNGTPIPAGMLWGPTAVWTEVIEAQADCWDVLPPLAATEAFNDARRAAENDCYKKSTPANRTAIGDWADLITDGSDGAVVTDTTKGTAVANIANGELRYRVDVPPLVRRVYRVSWQYWNADKTARKDLAARMFSTAILYAPDLVINLTQPGTVRIRVEPAP